MGPTIIVTNERREVEQEREVEVRMREAQQEREHDERLVWQRDSVQDYPLQTQLDGKGSTMTAPRKMSAHILINMSAPIQQRAGNCPRAHAPVACVAKYISLCRYRCRR